MILQAALSVFKNDCVGVAVEESDLNTPVSIIELKRNINSCSHEICE